MAACASDGYSQCAIWIAYLEHCRRLVSDFLKNPNGNSNEMETDNHVNTSSNKEVENKVVFDAEFLRKVFTRADDHLTETWGQTADPNCTILQ